jgi:BCD family chlorophyll transporter-like MFS transporter
MSGRGSTVDFWRTHGLRLLPFADAATDELPLLRILRLALFQIGAGMTFVLLNGTLNRVMIVELGISATLVSVMIALPLIIAPLRALIGFRSDTHVSFLGWRRVPYVFTGTMLQFGGLAILPFALILLSGDTHWPMWFAKAATVLAFALVGIGMHTVQTAGLALATDIAPTQSKTRVVALLYVMLLVGMVLSALIFAALLEHFSSIRLIQLIQGCAVVVLLLNLLAVWKQEVNNPAITHPERPRATFRQSWVRYLGNDQTRRFLWALALGTAAFSMQDILLEPFGGQVLHMDVSGTTRLTAMLVTGTLIGFAIASRSTAGEPCRLAAYGVTLGLFAFAAIIFAAPLGSPMLFKLGTFLIGMGAGLFSVSMLVAEMARRGDGRDVGLALGAWGAVQTTAAGIAIAFGGAMRDAVSRLAQNDVFGQTLNLIDTGYLSVYLLELALLFMTLAILGPLASRWKVSVSPDEKRFGMVAFPG